MMELTKEEYEERSQKLLDIINAIAVLEDDPKVWINISTHILVNFIYNSSTKKELYDLINENLLKALEDE